MQRYRRVVPEKTHDGKNKALVCVLGLPVGGLHCLPIKTRAGLRDRDYAMGYVTILWTVKRGLRPASQTTGFRDRAHWSELWLPVSSPVPFGSSVSASYAGLQSRWLNHVFAFAAHRFLRSERSGCGSQISPFIPAATPLRTSRGVGGHAVTSAPEGRGLHPHGPRVTRPYGLAAYLEVLTSFQPTSHR